MDPIEKALSVVKRAEFVPEYLQDQVDIDTPLPIGYGQTISQPTTLKMMLKWLEAQPRDRVLDVGSGSGWSTALLAHIVGPKGKIYAVEKIPELVDFGRGNCQKSGVKNVKFFEAGNALGLPKYAPYDRILVSAAACEFPKKLVEQLKVGGKLVIPIRSDILEIEKESKSSYSTKIHPGFVFVPLV
jgi:protein-L-isoaspartate(D-aspartate) O-methyltransferase